jgi:glycosyltransferase involved in cell wall biosynthesis
VLAAKAQGRKVIVFGWENLDRKIHPVQVAARKTVLSLANAIVCGNRQGAELVRRWGFKRTVDVIPQLGVEPTVFRCNRKPKADLFTIGFVGRLVNEKGVDILLKAVRLLAERGLPFRVKICGHGPCSEQLKRLASQLGITDRTIWMGAVPHEQVPEVMRDLDVLVLPSRSVDWWSEQFGHVLIEAMAAGVAVIGSSCGAIPEVIGRKDLIFPEEDAEGLAAILSRIITEQHWREEIEEYVLSRVHRHYTQHEIARQLATVWEQVLGNRSWSRQHESAKHLSADP